MNMALPTRMWSVIQLGFLAILFGQVGSVQRENFKTCDQSGFCKRHRRMQEGPSPYVVQMSTLKIESSKISVQLLNTNNQVTLALDLYALKHNMARLQINEVDPLYPRYQVPVGDCLVGEPEQDSITVVHQSDGGFTAKFENNEIEVKASPFRINFFIDGEPVISINAKGLLKFEQHRTKEPAAPEQPEEENKPEGEEEHVEGEQPEQKQEEEKKEDEEPDMWEETFKTHTDTKPRGPSSIGFDLSFPGCEHVYGLPEHADNLVLKSTQSTDPYRMYNLDVFEYELRNPMALYKSVPYMIAHNEKRTIGVFWQNAAEMWVDVKNEKADKGTFSKLVDMVAGSDGVPQIDTHWFAESGIIDLFILFGPKPKDVFTQYAALTGTTPLPPLFAIAYHQSRWNYNDEQDVANVDKNYDENDIPMDVIWLDIEHTDGKRYFTWDSSKFPDSVRMIDSVAAKGRKMVTIVDPHIKKDDNYKVYSEARDKDYPIKNKDSNHYEGWCWPGSSIWLDFVNPEIRDYWASKFSTEDYVGSTKDLFIWNDMNEPSVFNGPEITMHKDAKHFGDWEHRDVHNIYGTYVHRATFEGLLKRDPNQRPFVLSRAGFAGSQRYGAVWTGDNTGEWGHLKVSLPMLMTLNLAGITFSGADVGGFFKNPEHELLTRWYQAAAYQPFFRAHAHLDTRRREPWLLPEEHMTAIRHAIRARYSLLPYWYTLFHQSEKDGSPLMSPLWVEFPTEKAGYNTEDEHLVGPGLLVHPVTDAGASGVTVYFPGQGEVWYDVDNYKSYPGGNSVYISADLNKIPVFQRGGYIIPRKQRIRRASILTRHDPFTLIVALNKQGEAEGQLYVDDYNSHEYQKGQYLLRQFTFKNRELTSENADEKGHYKTNEWLERVVVVGLSPAPVSVEITAGGESHALDHTYDSHTQVLVIRKPGILVGENFTITLK